MFLKRKYSRRKIFRLQKAERIDLDRAFPFLMYPIILNVCFFSPFEDYFYLKNDTDM
jgi:polyferredoxin